MTDVYEKQLDVEVPPVRGSTYWCFTPDNLEGALAGWDSHDDAEQCRIERQIVREFLYSAGLLRSGMRKEARRQHNPAIDNLQD